MSNYTVPGMEQATAEQVCTILQERLVTYTDLHLTLKHIHWNVVGPNFIAVHEMLDPQVDSVRAYADELAERIATLGGVPRGTPGAVVEGRRWDDYKLDRATVRDHLAELDRVYVGVIEDSRNAIGALEELDLVSQDMLIGHTSQLEQYHWFVRAHLEDADGGIQS